MIPVLVDRAQLADLPGAVLVDVRWYLDGTDGRAAYEAGHLPGAVWVDLDRELAAHADGPDDPDAPPATAGRHPFPTPAAFATAMTRLGIGDATPVVAYDDSGGLTAGRLVVMLRMLGHPAAVLDGGLRTWDRELDAGWVEPEPAFPPFTERPWPTERFATADDTAALAATRGEAGVVLDARVAERFTGEVAMIDPRPGHVPGARNAPWSAVLAEDGRVRSIDELREHYAALGADTAPDAITYCGSGVSACMNIVAMEHAGLRPPRLYVASWSGWSADPIRPTELGG